MDIDRPSLAAAALYDLKNEQLLLANAALQQQQQQASLDRHTTEALGDGKSQEGQNITDQSMTTTAGSQQYAEEGRGKLLFCSLDDFVF